MAFFQEDVAAPNLNPAVINAWTNSGVLSSSAQGESCKEVFSYIYGLLHSNQYRERYGEFLAMEFPRIFEPRDRGLLLQIARCGDLLLSLHLLESHTLYNHVTTLTVPDDALVEKITYSDETVWIDKKKTRGFEGVPEEVWNFSIGGYQVCEKWLKDRGPKKGKPGRTLTDDDIDHYQKIIFSISKTIRVMAEIDEVIEAHGGWPDAFVTPDD